MKVAGFFLLAFIIQNSVCYEIKNSSRFKRQSTQAICGKSVKKSGLIVGGNYFEKNDYPWMAVLMNNSYFYFGGGVIISTNRVLTAAHCILNKQQLERRKPEDFKVILGAFNLTDQFESDRKIFTPSRTLIHPNWNNSNDNFDADIAVIEFSRKIPFDEKIKPICLWNFNFLPNNREGIVIGYGKSEDTSKLHETIPKELKATITPNEECVHKEFAIAKISSPRTFCFGDNNGSVPCLGDSGHSVAIAYRGTFYLRGLVSASYVNKATRTCTVSKFAVITDVLKFKNWIENPSEEYLPPPSSSHFDNDEQFKSCGNSIVSTGLILNGTDFARAKYPWMVLLTRFGKQKDDKENFFCGGMLITENRVIAAAQCLKEKNVEITKTGQDFFVTLGVHDISSKFEIGRQSVEVKKVFVHPDWKSESQNYDADIALIKLKSDVYFTNYIQPICLWKQKTMPNIGSGVIVGYGYTDSLKNLATTPKELETPIVSNEDCFLKSRTLVLLSSNRTFCAGSADGSGPCNGDSGNGLFIKYQGKFYLRGIIAASLINDEYFCDTFNYAVYTDVFKYQDWIDEVSQDENEYAKPVPRIPTTTQNPEFWVWN